MTEEKLKELTEMTMGKVFRLPIVTPQIYNKIFLEICEKDEVDISELHDIKLNEGFISQSVLEAEEIMKKSEENIKDLEENTEQAAKAIEEKDETAMAELQKKVEALKSRVSKLQGEMYIDALTKVRNRKYLMDKILNNGNYKEDGAIGLIDLNKFKYINDTFGHATGDKVLKLIATTLQGIAKKLGDTIVVRYGGDEFMVFSKAPQDEFQATLKRDRDNLKKKNIVSKGQQFKASFAFGIASYKTGDSFKDILEIADEIMYKDKGNEKR
jgi:diguanylate cyclase (GGDEF)-like protein